MSHADTPDFEGLPLAAVLRINKACDQFEAAWRNGESPRLADYLAGVDVSEREVLRASLLQIETDYQRISFSELKHRLRTEGLWLPEYKSHEANGPHSLIESLVESKTLTRFQASSLLAEVPRPLLLDDYLLLERIAEGGMGVVYRAVHRRMNRTVALKVFAAHPDDADRRSRWFQREVRAAAMLTHPNIVTAFDAGEARGLAYLVTEFVDGVDLQRWVVTHGTMSIAEATRAIRDAAVGLRYAHHAGVIHRDIKPSNLIRNRDGLVRILDVGLARPTVAIPGETDSGLNAVVGTPAYMSPEQLISPKKVDVRADIYSLGCTAYFLLTGRRAHPDVKALDWFADLAHRDPPRLRDHRPDASQGLEALLLRMMAFDASDRPGSMQEVVEAIDALGPRINQKRWMFVVGIGLAITIALTLAVWPGKKSPSPDVSTATIEPRNVPFDGAKYQQEWSSVTGMPVEFEPIPGVRVRLIPPGRFMMGTPPDLVERLLADRLEGYTSANAQGEVARRVSIDSPFYMTVSEVTVAQYRLFVRSQVPEYVTFAEQPTGYGFRLDQDRVWRAAKGVSWRTAGAQQLTDDHPAGNLIRDDAIAYCRWLSSKVGDLFECRLPTEREWEYACRAGSDGHWSFGSSVQDLDRHAWYFETIDVRDGAFRPVGMKAPNGFGLVDMHGNLAEWCAELDSRAEFVLRGGNIRSPAMKTRAAWREIISPNVPLGGFRVVLIPKPR